MLELDAKLAIFARKDNVFLLVLVEEDAKIINSVIRMDNASITVLVSYVNLALFAKRVSAYLKEQILLVLLFCV